MKDNDLFNFMQTATKNMADEYYRIQKRATEDAGTAGDQGEENWANLFKNWLPPTFQIVTKGRIMSFSGIASPQIDVLILQPEYPKHLIDKKLYLAGGVLAAFECKTTLIAAHIKKAIENAVILRELLPVQKGTPYKELHSPIIYGLLAHSHSWKGKKSKPLQNINEALNLNDKIKVNHPREMLDILCVADLATWSASKVAFIGPKYISDWKKLSSIYGKDGSATTSYVRHAINGENQEDNFTPIGCTIVDLYCRLAWENISMRKLSDYFSKVNLLGSGEGEMRLWDASIYSEEIRNKITNGYLCNGVFWNEWSVHF